MFGGGDRVAERCVHHHDALGRGGGNIDIIDADTRTADDFEVRRRVKDGLGHFGRTADCKAVIVANHRGKFFLGLVGNDIYITAALMKIFAALGSILSEINTRGLVIGDAPASLVLSSPTRSGIHDLNFRFTLRCQAMDPRVRGMANGGVGFRVVVSQSSHGPSASTSAVSTVAPHHIRSPGGASRYPAIS